ncbi:hypothetical protein RFI_24261 [Reticulomyxa filosa]|uniref:Clathrin light chain n=1 Tax=Reticulomyxa filosa TaxID=46433 RepID=X6MJ65_RETFI|nr:hypothetical protein RFI_24261 [Reticulomyxa filosa]|eukprot:ETO13115.1 hypothetical protein RFI_24261 [Reticulomyxa filosa]
MKRNKIWNRKSYKSKRKKTYKDVTMIAKNESMKQKNKTSNLLQIGGCNNLTKILYRLKETQLREDLKAVFEHGTVWEQVAKMVNLQEPTDKTGPSGDQERTRKLLTQLKNDKR